MRHLLTALLIALPTAVCAADTVPVRFEARLVDGAPPLKKGMTWRVFREAEDAATVTSGLALTAQSGDAQGTFRLAPGLYYVHAAFGRAGVTQRIEVENVPLARSFVLHAGGLRLDATSGGRALDPKRLRFNIYEAKRGRGGMRRLIALNVRPAEMVRLNAGTYHVLSSYGQINTRVRADLVVREGEVTDATMQHRGAPVALRLSSSAGGPPVANTTWTIFTTQGQKVFETKRLTPTLVLAEGSYEAVAVNGARTLRHPFDVEAGEPLDIEVLIPQQR